MEGGFVVMGWDCATAIDPQPGYERTPFELGLGWLVKLDGADFVGRAGLAWKGTAKVGRKAKWPRWTPTKNMIRRQPRKYARYAGGVPGGPSNPLGARALYLYRNGRDTMYRIHGTNQPRSIGRAVSNGCIRMLNAHVKDLYRRVPVGARVVVL